MITLYLLEESRAERVKWALDLLKLDYRLEIFRRDPNTKLADPALKKIHPSGKSPLIKDGDQVFAESGVIIDYLVTKYGKDSLLAPKDMDEKWAIEYGLFASESNTAISFMQLYINSMARERIPWGIRQAASKFLDSIEAAYAHPELESNMSALQETVNRNGGYFCGGHISGADLMYLYQVRKIRSTKVLKNFDSKYPGLVEWQDRVYTEVEAAKKTPVEVVNHATHGSAC